MFTLADKQKVEYWEEHISETEGLLMKFMSDEETVCQKK